MGNGVIENSNKTIKSLLKKLAAEKPKEWHRYLRPLMFAVKDTPQDSTGFTPFELLYELLSKILILIRVKFHVSPLTCVVALTTLASPCECVINGDIRRKSPIFPTPCI